MIAIVRPISAEPGVLTLRDTEGQTLYSPVVQSRYEVIEYLKGDGDPEIIVNANNFHITTRSTEQALQTAESNLDAQTSNLGGGEGVVFLQRTQYPDRVLDISRKASGSEWKQYNAQTGLLSAVGDISDISTTLRRATETAVDDEQSEELSIGELRERVKAMEALLREGEGVQGYKECVESKLLFENFRRKYNDTLTSVSDVATFYSGLPANSVVHEFSNKYPRQWFTGVNAPLFHYGDYQIATTRPIFGPPLCRGCAPATPRPC